MGATQLFYKTGRPSHVLYHKIRAAELMTATNSKSTGLAVCNSRSDFISHRFKTTPSAFVYNQPDDYDKPHVLLIINL
jgi:hypothetical protein